LAQLEYSLLAVSGKAPDGAAQKLGHARGNVVSTVERACDGQVGIFDRRKVLDLFGSTHRECVWADVAKRGDQW
jgi:hypothetical protein